MRAVAEQKYVMTRLHKGDYLLPSNDGQTLWRIYTYQEDGSLVHVHSGGERAVIGSFWACARRPFPHNATRDEIADWSEWEFWAGPLTTRRDAIREALQA